jgi:4-methyl-5(b-hydroxyethyl)-thiazole monophosphate biosynthesis
MGMNALVLLADGFEEIEAVTIVDVLRRAEVAVTTAALGKSPVTGAHGIALVADRALDGLSVADFDAVVLPGGMPGSRHLKEDARVLSLLRQAMSTQKTVAAVCAAPIALEAAGVLAGRRATSYPGHELPSASYSEERVVIDGNLVTSRGPGTALEFALALVEKLAGADVKERLARAMLVSGS